MIEEIRAVWRQQLFGGEGAGAGAAAAGPAGEGQAAAGESVEGSGDDGRKTLRELGVPEEVLDRSRSKGRLPSRMQNAFRNGAGAYAGGSGGETGEEGSGQEAGSRQPEQNREQQAGDGGLDWEAIKKNPAFNERIQGIVQSRLKEESAASEKLSALAPVLQEIARQKGMDFDPSDIGSLDVNAFTRALQRDDSFFESKAAELGVTPDVARQLIGLQEFQEDTLKQQEEDAQRKEFEAHIGKLFQQAEEFKQIIPDFDLDREFQNERFVQLTSPQAGLTVEEAFYALHHDEIQAAGMAAATRVAQEKIANSVRANRMRPQESGGGGQPAEPPRQHYSKMTAQERADLKKQIMQAGARGEKIYPT